MRIKLNLPVFSKFLYTYGSKSSFATISSLVVKKNLRKKYKQIKIQFLTKYNNNSYHYGLLNNLGQVLSTYSRSDSKLIRIGSYINKPILEIVPPLLTHSNTDILYKYKLNQIQFLYAYPYFAVHTSLNPTSLDMKFCIHSMHSTYKTGPYGIKVLDMKKLELRNQLKKQTQEHQIINLSKHLDFVLVPLVAFTEGKHRIGEGGGYYDRFIQFHRHKHTDAKRKAKNTIFIGIGLQGLKIPQCEESQYSISPFRQQDQKLDLVITQRNIYD